MEAQLQRRIQRYGWDKAASAYEEGWARQIEPAQQRLLEIAGLKQGERVLDVACGTGLVTFPAAAAVGPAGRVLGVDLSQSMVDDARAEAARWGLEYTRFERMDAEALDVSDNFFDVALCSLGLMYFPDPVAALDSMNRALRPGGRAVALVWGARERCGWSGIFPTVDARVRSEVCPLFFRLGTGDTLRHAFQMAGFARVESERLSVTLHYDTAEEACTAAFAAGPVALAYSRFDTATRQEAHAEYLASIKAFRTGRGYDIPGEFVLTRGAKE